MTAAQIRMGPLRAYMTLMQIRIRLLQVPTSFMQVRMRHLQAYLTPLQVRMRLLQVCTSLMQIRISQESTPSGGRGPRACNVKRALVIGEGIKRASQGHVRLPQASTFEPPVGGAQRVPRHPLWAHSGLDRGQQGGGECAAHCGGHGVQSARLTPIQQMPWPHPTT